MVRTVIKARPSDNLLRVQELLKKHKITRVVVADDTRPRGILTQKDIIRYLLEDMSDRDLDQIRASEVMTANLITLSESSSVADAARLMIDKGISSIVILNIEGKLAGLVTKTDLCLFFGSRSASVEKVRDWMTPKPVAVRGSTSIFRVAAMMQEHKISRVLVQDGRMEGIVTFTDLVSASFLFNPKRAIESKKALSVKGMILRPMNIILVSARDVMTANPVTVTPDDLLASAARLMTTHGISGLPVVDKKQRAVGMVTKTDITRAIARMI
jgi:CBS domain-containing protein